MSYKTRYRLEYAGDTPTLEEVATKLAETVDLRNTPPLTREQNIQIWIFILEGDPVKWYAHQEELAAITPNWPDTLFILSGVGEDQGGFWKEYHQNGKVARISGQVVYPEFQPEMLREPSG